MGVEPRGQALNVFIREGHNSRSKRGQTWAPHGVTEQLDHLDINPPPGIGVTERDFVFQQRPQEGGHGLLESARGISEQLRVKALFTFLKPHERARAYT